MIHNSTTLTALDEVDICERANGEPVGHEPRLHTSRTTDTLRAGRLNHPNRTLLKACDKGDLALVKYIVCEGLADINCRDKAGMTPVMTAAKKGKLSVFDFLVNQGCGLSLVNDNTYNVLHIVCTSGHIDLVKRLIVNEKYDIESRGWNGMTPVMIAVYFGHREVVDFLISEGCDMLSVDNTGNNILHMATMGGHASMTKYILKKETTNINSRGQFGKTPVIFAAEKGPKDLFDLLVDEGCNLEEKDDNGMSILHAACRGGHRGIVKSILTQSGLNINSRDRFGRSPVLVAAVSGHREIVDVLVSKGCDITLEDNSKNNILHLACISGQKDVVNRILMKRIFPIDCRGYVGRTPVLTAAQFGQVNVVEFLKLKGCNLRMLDNDNNTILHLACIDGHLDMVNYILEKRLCSIDRRGFLGRTPVMMAAEFKQRRVVELLIRKGSNLKIVDNNGSNILHEACMGGDVDMVKYLLRLKIVTGKERNKFGQTPAQVAESKGHSAVVALFV